MSKQWQIRRGTTAENDEFIGAIGELTMDTDKKQIRVHDGTTQGGHIFGDTVIEWQAPTVDNNYTWYRKYRSGWVEQGGRCNAVAYNSGTKNVTFPIQMADTNYCAISCPLTDANNDGSWNISSRCAGYTTTSMTVRGGANASSAYTGLCVWEVKGFAA